MILLFAEFFIFVLLGWIYVVIFKVLFVKNYKDYPPYFPTFGRAKKIISDCVGNQLEKSQKQLSVVDPGCGTALILSKLAKKSPQNLFVGINGIGYCIRLQNSDAGNLKMLLFYIRIFLIILMKRQILLFVFCWSL